MICSDMGTPERSGVAAASYRRRRRRRLVGPGTGVGVGGEDSSGGGGAAILAKRPLESLLSRDAGIRGVAKDNQRARQIRGRTRRRS